MIIAFQSIEKCFFRNSFVPALFESVEAFRAGIWMAHFHVAANRRSGTFDISVHLPETAHSPLKTSAPCRNAAVIVDWFYSLTLYLTCDLKHPLAVLGSIVWPYAVLKSFRSDGRESG
jgi:hypothetical protein